jgi:hypothetical protein
MHAAAVESTSATEATSAPATAGVGVIGDQANGHEDERR